MRKAVIIITPDNKNCQMDIQTGGVSDIEILDGIKTVSEFFAKKLLEEYQSVAGNDFSHLDDYLEFLRKNKS